MAHARGRGVRRSGNPRRKTNWTSFTFGAAWGAVAVDGAAAFTVLDAGPDQNQTPHSTLVRVRGQIGVHTNSAEAVTGLVGLGLCVVSARAAAAGIAQNAIPLPITNADDECWLWHKFVPIRGLTVAAESARAGSPFINALIDVDSKAMRKLADDLHVVYVAESSEVAFNHMIGIRLLTKLS